MEYLVGFVFYDAFTLACMAVSVRILFDFRLHVGLNA